MSDIINENGDLVWYGSYCFFEVGEIIYNRCSPTQSGKVVGVRYIHLTNLDEYANAGKKTVEQEVLIRWLRPNTRKKLGDESWQKSSVINSLTGLIEDHERKANKFRKDLSLAEKL